MYPWAAKQTVPRAAEDMEVAMGRDEWSKLPGHQIGLCCLGHLSDVERLKRSLAMLRASQVQLKVGYTAQLSIPR